MDQKERGNYYDVIISGGGMIGGSMAAVLANEPLFSDKSVLLLEAGTKKNYEGAPENYSSRTVALSPSTRELFEEIGVWQHIEGMRYQPVKRMQVWESCSNAMIGFQHDDMNESLAYIVENDIVQAAIDQQVHGAADRVEVKYESPVESYHFPSSDSFVEGESSLAEVTLKSGETIHTQLVIGADGFKSKVRSTADIHTIGWEYEQMGVVAVLELSEPTENNTAWQRFLPTGPIAMLPLSPEHSCLIWSTGNQEARNLVKLQNHDFVDAVNDAFWSDAEQDPYAQYAEQVMDNVLLTLGLEGSSSQQLPPTVVGVGSGSRAAFPLGFNHASQYVKARMAIIGDAAHRVHPLAGQGANLGFSDVACLKDNLCNAITQGADLGSLPHLLEYETQRQRHNVPVMAGIDGLSKLYGSTWSPLVVARTLGLQATNALNPLKSFFMKTAQT